MKLGEKKPIEQIYLIFVDNVSSGRHGLLNETPRARHGMPPCESLTRRLEGSLKQHRLVPLFCLVFLLAIIGKLQATG